MRVISGERKGHNLVAPKGRNVRPTEDRVKESLFNIISPIVPGSIILDLFAGTGSIGIEFLSRGASFGFFVDKSVDSITSIKRNLEHTKYEGKSEILNLDAKIAIKRLSSRSIAFDYIYIDPPFDQTDLFHDVLELVSDEKILKPYGIVIVEHDKKLILRDEYNRMVKYDERSYGTKLMTYYKLEEVQQ